MIEFGLRERPLKSIWKAFWSTSKTNGSYFDVIYVLCNHTGYRSCFSFQDSLVFERVPHLGCPKGCLANSKIKQARSYAETQQAQSASRNIGGTKQKSPKSAVAHDCSMHCFNISSCIESSIS